MSKVKPCIEPRIGDRIEEYNKDAELSPETMKLPLEERFMFEVHLIRCPFCRKKLTLVGRLTFETMLIQAGFFIDDPEVLLKRIRWAKRSLNGELTSEEFEKNRLEVTAEEHKKVKAFMEEDC